MATFTVTNTNDSGAGSLRDAVAQANAAAGADAIAFDASLDGQTITLTSAEIFINADLVIDGDMDGDNKADIIISGGGTTRLFQVTGSTTATFQSLTLADGVAGETGGAISGYYVAINIFDTTIQNCIAGTDGGAVYGRYSDVTITNSTLVGNSAAYSGGAIKFYGGFASGGSLTITNSTLDGNTAARDGGGIAVYNGYATILNSTITGNHAGYTSGAGGISNGYGSLYLRNTVTVDNTIGVSDQAADVSGSVAEATNSVIGSGNGLTITQNNSSTIGAVDAGLGALQDNGGTVWTRNIDIGSILIGAGDNTSAAGLTTDANGKDRVVGGTVDIGATEFRLVVTTAEDVVDAGDGELSLREAVALANANADDDAIVFDVSLAGQTIILNNGELTLTTDITIDGDVDGDNKADIIISGNNASRIFNLSGSTTDAVLLSLTLTNGQSADNGGAILADGIATLDMADVTVAQSTSAGQGGGLAAASVGNLTIDASLFTGNEAAIRGGGLFLSGTTAALANTTVDGNRADTSGGGIRLSGASTLDLVNSTVTGNQGNANGAGTSSGGGLDIDTGAVVNAVNAVVAENTSGTGSALNDVRGTVNASANSVFGTAVTITTATASQTGIADVGLGTLQDNGGTTMTRDILGGSLLVNAGDNAGAAGLATDANGNVRVSFGTVDVGATEFAGPLVVTTALDVIDANDGLLSLREAILLANADAAADTITFAAGLAGQTMAMQYSPFALTSDITIDGDVDGDNKADITISGGNLRSIFGMTGAATDVDLRSLTLADANTPASGGAILANGISSLTISDTTVRDNVGGAAGGLLIANTTAALTNVLISGNHANNNGGGLYTLFSTVTLNNCTIDGNSTNANGGGIAFSASTLNIINSTITGNIADADGSNGSYGGGISIGSANGTISLVNSVVAENTSGAAATANDVAGTITSAHNSVFGTSATLVSSIANQFNVADIGLGALQDNGGTTMTRNIEAGSVLINAGDTTAAAALPTDANGNDRIVAGTVDIGATEFALVVTTAADVVADDGVLSLREAIAFANAGADADIITFDASLAGQTIVLGGTELSLIQDVTIDGDVDGDGKADITISGNNASRIFAITGAATDAELRSLTLSNGCGNSYRGGAVRADGISTLTISDCTINDSYDKQGGGGGLDASNTTLVMTNSLIAGNQSSIWGGGIHLSGVDATIINSTIDGNRSGLRGGGVYAVSSTLDLINSTVTDNSANIGNSQVNVGGGLFLYAVTSNLVNTVVAGNIESQGAQNDVSGTISSATHSVFSTDVSGVTGGVDGNLENVADVKLGELLDNGGTVLTRSPLDGSILIGAGSNAALPLDDYDIDGDGNTTEVLPLDGRDGLRIIGGSVDVGAVEQVVDETIRGTAGSNTIIGGRGKDALYGLDGDDIIKSGARNDVVDGGAGADDLNGGGGKLDTLTYENSAAAVTVDLDSGTGTGGWAEGDTMILFERVIGSGFGDSLIGGAGTNILRGENGADTLQGRGGDDELDGGKGADRLIGNGGHDTLTGDLGKDTFVLAAQQSSSDVITDFASADDQLEISAALFGGGLTAGNLASGRFVINTTGLAEDANDRFIFNSLTNELFYDADGTGVDAGNVIATFITAPTGISASDFDIV